MSVEVLLFGILGLLTIASAAAMLLSKNAVHSALFLIVNFIGVAMLYLMLEAPFLALVQVAVYAGAIMVLFLFVIMLLGAEKTGRGAALRRFPWLPPLGMGLAAFLVIAGAWALGQGDIEARQPAEADGRIRFVHAAPQAAVVDASAPAESDDADDADDAEAEAPVTARPPVLELPETREFALVIDGEVIDESFIFGEATDFITVAPGEHTLALRAVDGTDDLRTTEFSVEAGDSTTLIISGEVDLDFSTVTQVEGDGYVIFNAYSPERALSVGNLQNELFDPRINDVSNIMTGRSLATVVEALPYGAASEVPAQYPAGFPHWVAYVPTDGLIDNFGFVPDGDRLSRALVVRLTDTLDLNAGESGLIVIAAERRPDGSLRAIGTEIAHDDAPAFGSPVSLGRLLFTEYLLPFQLIAMLLLAAMVGVIVITYRGEHVPKPSRLTRRKVSRPLTSVIASQTGADLTSGAPQLPERTETPAGD